MQTVLPNALRRLIIIIFFWSNEHEPIHVHGERQGRENRAELRVEGGKVAKIVFGNVKGRRPLEPTEFKLFEEFVVNKADDIVQKWIDYFVLHKKITFERVTRKIR